MSLRQYAKMPMRFKYASQPEMGDAQYVAMSSATGDEGRAHARTSDDPQAQVSNAFDQNQRQLHIDGWNETRQIPTGSYQSKVAVTVEDLTHLSPVPVRHTDVADIYGGGYYGHDDQGIHIGLGTSKNPYILAHEIGHAESDKNWLGKAVHSGFAQGLPRWSPFIAGALGAALGGGQGSRALRALATGLGLNAPVLVGEGIADYRGYKVLQRAGATDAELKKYVKTLTPLQATYLVDPARASLSAYGGMLLNKYSAHKLDGRLEFRGLDISVETAKGNYRYWRDPHNGEQGKTLMKYPYGYIRRTEGLDGDHVDCFVGPNESAPIVYVVTTNKPPSFTAIDEEKCMLGFSSAEQAKQAFLEHYSDPRFFKSMRAMAFEDFKTKVLKTANGGSKKVSFDISSNLISNSPGTQNDQTPGDYLGFPASSLVGLRTVVADPLDPQDKINSAFKFNDVNTDTRVMDPSASSVASSPGV